jgi:hypothetical protein
MIFAVVVAVCGGGGGGGVWWRWWSVVDCEVVEFEVVDVHHLIYS